MKTFNTLTKRWVGVRSGPQPSRDWHALLALTFVLLVAVTVWSLSVFETIISGGTVGVIPSSATPQETRVNLIDSVRKAYDARAAEEANYSAGIYSYTDPSR